METREPRILCYDIETSPLVSYTWGVYQTDVVHILEDWQILTVAWKWLGEKTVHVLGQDDFDDYVPGVNDDIHVVEKIRELFDESDAVLAHNGNSFDQKKVTARMIIHNMPPPSPYKQIDTKLVAKRYAAFTRNNLKWLAKDFSTRNQKGSPGGIETWRDCLAGDPKAWAKMKKYNKQDITTLEDIYLRLRPWISNHPNFARLSNKPNGCPKCGSSRLQSRGYRVTNVGMFNKFACMECGGWCSMRSAEKQSIDTTKPQYINYS